MTVRDLETVQRQLEARRRAKDKWALTAEDSPVEHHARHTLTGLEYFPIDFKYRVPARMEREEKPHTFQVQTTTGEWRDYVHYGTLHFEIDGEPLLLLVFQPIGEKAGKGRKSLFVPFKDRTAPGETYGAGRYLDLAENPDSDEYTLDFNEAYNPYCAYSPNWSCTIPPRENHLSVEIRAGEKNLPGH